MNTKEELNRLFEILTELGHYHNASSVIDFDLKTVAPEKAYDYESETANFIQELAYKITKGEEYISLVKSINAHKDDLHPYDQRLIYLLNKSIEEEEQVTEELYSELLKLISDTYSYWLKAKEKNDYSIFVPYFKKMIDINKKLVDLNPHRKETYYDTMLSNFEEGYGIKEYDEYFSKLKERLIPLLEKVNNSNKKIRTDFLTRKVPVEKQEKFSQYLMDVVGFDKKCGCLSTTMHPFTNTLARYDTRITTHYYEDNFISNIYSVIHEAGHAIFGQNEPDEIYEHHLENHMSLGMHESVSRFYENRLARSKEFIHFLYPKLMEHFGEELGDVSEEELYLGINAVSKEPRRTESDELSYSLHIIIRYELEKEFINGDIDIKHLDKKWNKLYEEYLGITPIDDNEGILQDVHWTDTYGYFPTYAIGNAYNAMYLKTMEEELDVFDLVAKGDFAPINRWMKEHVFKKASYLPPKEWIKDITGRELDAEDFIKYLEEKYAEIYNI